MSHDPFEAMEHEIDRLLAGDALSPAGESALLSRADDLRLALGSVPMDTEARTALKQRLLVSWESAQVPPPPAAPQTAPRGPSLGRRLAAVPASLAARALLAAACVVLVAGLSYLAISTPGGMTRSTPRPVAVGASPSPAAPETAAATSAAPSATTRPPVIQAPSSSPTPTAPTDIPAATRPPAQTPTPPVRSTAAGAFPTSVSTMTPVGQSPASTASPTPVPTVTPTFVPHATTLPAPATAVPSRLTSAPASDTAIPTAPPAPRESSAASPSSTSVPVASAAPPPGPAATQAAGPPTELPPGPPTAAPSPTSAPALSASPSPATVPSATPAAPLAPSATAALPPTTAAVPTPDRRPISTMAPQPTAQPHPTAAPLPVAATMAIPTSAPSPIPIAPPPPTAASRAVTAAPVATVTPPPSTTQPPLATATVVEAAQIQTTPTPHLSQAEHGTGGTPTATAQPFVPVPYPRPQNAILSSPLSFARPWAVGADVLLSTTLPTEPTAASVASISPPVVGAGVALNIAAGLGPDFAAAAAAVLTTTASRPGPFSVVGPWSGGTYHLVVGASATAFSVALTMVRPGTPLSTGDAGVDNSDASARALWLLQRLKLYRDNLVMLNVSQQGNDESESVSFGQTIGGVVILGHTAATVTFDGSGRLASLRYTYLETNGGQSYPLRGLVQAKSDLEQGGGFYTGPAAAGVGTPLDIQAITLGYVAVQGGGNPDAMYLEPVYVVTGTIPQAGGRSPFTAYVPALDPRAYGR